MPIYYTTHLQAHLHLHGVLAWPMVGLCAFKNCCNKRMRLFVYPFSCQCWFYSAACNPRPRSSELAANSHTWRKSVTNSSSLFTQMFCITDEWTTDEQYLPVFITYAVYSSSRLYFLVLHCMSFFKSLQYRPSQLVLGIVIYSSRTSFFKNLKFFRLQTFSLSSYSNC